MICCLTCTGACLSLALQMKKISPPNLSQWGRKEGDESKNILSLAQKLDFWECAVAWLGSGETEVQKYGIDP